MQKNLSSELKSISHFDHSFASSRKDLPEVPKEAKKGIKFEFIKNTSEVLKLAISSQ